MRDHNWRRGGYGKISLERVLAVSSNIGMGQAVDKAFHDNQQQFFDLLDKMSFGQPDSIEGISGLKPSSYSSPKDSDWSKWKIWWSAIGFERKMAPIQMLTFYNAIANDGKMVKPTLKTGKVEIINPQIAEEGKYRQHANGVGTCGKPRPREKGRFSVCHGGRQDGHIASPGL